LLEYSTTELGLIWARILSASKSGHFMLIALRWNYRTSSDVFFPKIISSQGAVKITVYFNLRTNVFFLISLRTLPYQISTVGVSSAICTTLHYTYF